jgi:Cu(I)/Ag(I) efflux system protein CusF
MKKLDSRLFAPLVLTLLIGAGAALANGATATGKVQKVDNAAAKVTIKHGAIKALDMPDPMTMVYQVKDPSMLKAIKAGDDVTFDVDHADSGYVVTRIQKK